MAQNKKVEASKVYKGDTARDSIIAMTIDRTRNQLISEQLELQFLNSLMTCQDDENIKKCIETHNIPEVISQLQVDVTFNLEKLRFYKQKRDSDVEKIMTDYKKYPNKVMVDKTNAIKEC